MRTSRLFSVLSLFLLAIPAFSAGPECARRGLSEMTGMAPEDITFTTTEINPLYVEIGDLTVGDRISLEIRLDGLSRFSEELELVADEGRGWGEAKGTPVVEFLPGNTSRRATLHRLAPSATVEIAISHNGKLLEVVPFLDLVNRSAELSEGTLAPHALRTTVTRPAAPQAAEKYSCSEACELEQDYCYDHLCGPGASPSCYDNCDDDYLDCMEGCGSCQPSSSSTTTYTQVALIDTNYVQCRTSQLFGKGMYERFNIKIRKTVTTTTINADCSQTVTTNISYVYQYCWSFVYSSQFCNSLGGIPNFC